jgi:hypothetical protein
MLDSAGDGRNLYLLNTIDPSERGGDVRGLLVGGRQTAWGSPAPRIEARLSIFRAMRPAASSRPASRSESWTFI